MLSDKIVRSKLCYTIAFKKVATRADVNLIPIGDCKLGAKELYSILQSKFGSLSQFSYFDRVKIWRIPMIFNHFYLNVNLIRSEKWNVSQKFVMLKAPLTSHMVYFLSNISQFVHRKIWMYHVMKSETLIVFVTRGPLGKWSKSFVI